MKTPCILALKKDSLINLALINLISASEDGLVFYESTAQSIDEFFEEINTSKADVILLEKTCPYAGKNALTKLLMLYPKLLVIIVNEESNWLQIFRRDDILMRSPADLIGVIQSV